MGAPVRLNTTQTSAAQTDEWDAPPG